MIQYAKIVKEMHWPEISEKKRREVETHRVEIENWNRKLRSPSKNRHNSDERSSSAKHKKYKPVDWKNMRNSMKPPTEEMRKRP